MSTVRNDHLSRFYTKPDVGSVLIERMSCYRPRSLIDLGSGRGSLSQAAVERWHDLRYVTIDIDERAAIDLRSDLKSGHASRHTHYVYDVLDPNLPESVFKDVTFDASISNPPYSRPEWRPGFETILDRAGIAKAMACRSDIGADILFLAQSIRLTSSGGIIGLILPDAVITGRQYADLRKALLERHEIGAVVQLPRRSFRGTEAQAFILVFRKDSISTSGIPLQRLDPSGELSDPMIVDREGAVHRMDYSFHVADMPRSSGVTLQSLGASVRRGSINATTARRGGQAIFHTSDFCPASNGYLSFSGIPATIERQAVVAEPGDILLARIDRNLERKVALVVAGRAVLSDCVYRIRTTPELSHKIVAVLKSDEGVRLLAAAARGIGARLIGKAELLSIPFPI